MLPGKQSNVFDSNKVQEIFFICKNYFKAILKSRRTLLKSSMNYYIKKHGLIGNIGNIGNQFRTNVHPHLNSYFNGLMNFSKLFATRIVK